MFAFGGGAGAAPAVYVLDSDQILSEDVTSTECGLARVGRQVAADFSGDLESGRGTLTFALEGVDGQTRFGLAGAAGAVLLAPSQI